MQAGRAVGLRVDRVLELRRRPTQTGRALGVLYTEHSGLAAMSPIASLWSYETRARGRDRRAIAANPDGSHEYWLDRSDPLLNTILPGTAVSVVVNFADLWTAGRSLVTLRPAWWCMTIPFDWAGSSSAPGPRRQQATRRHWPPSKRRADF